MALPSEAIQLAEASDWRGLQRLLDRSPECAQAVGEYGMLPVHWACTESQVPVPLLNQLLTAHRPGARKKNDAGLLPLHIAIRARTSAAWLESLLNVYPEAVFEDAPDGISVFTLANQAGLDADSIDLLRKTYNKLVRKWSDANNENNNCEDNHQEKHDERAQEHPENDDSVVSKVNPQILKLQAQDSLRKASFSSSECKTPPSVRDSLASIESDLATPPSPRDPLISPSSNSSNSTCSVNTAPLPTTAVPPQQRLLQQQFERKHSLDYHVHAAAAAAAARQFQETLSRGNLLYSAHHIPPPPRSLPVTHTTVNRGRHQSLPVIPNFKHMPYLTSPMQPSSEQSSDDEEEQIRCAENFEGSPDARRIESPPEWKRDDECSICRASFGMFKHRHHCRNCGKSICGQHSAAKKLVMESKGFTTPQRVCISCYPTLVSDQASPTQNQQISNDVGFAAEATPAAAFYRNQQQTIASNSTSMMRSHPSMDATYASRRRSATPTLTSSCTTPSSLSDLGSFHLPASTRSSVAASESQSQLQCLELRRNMARQQEKIEVLSREKIELQQQVLEQQELQAETMLLVTQLMTRVSVLETHKIQQEDARGD